VAVVVSCIPAPHGAFAPIALVVVLIAYLNAGAVKRAGAAGEDEALQELSRLPDSYVILNQLVLPHTRSRTGVIELDFVVIGPTGVFVVEVKNQKGRVVCSEDGHTWPVQKISKRGNPYMSSMRNPIAQLKNQIWALKTYLEQKGHRAWIEGVVFFPNCESEVEYAGGLRPRTPCLFQAGLADHIQACQSKGVVRDPGRMTRDLVGVGNGAGKHNT